MFWKKRQNNNELLHYQTNSQRNYFRIFPSESQPVIIHINKTNLILRDISAGGISFKSTAFNAGETLNIKLKLPDELEMINCSIKIVRIEPPNICCCQFKQIDADAAEKIHHYILNRQKSILREKR